MAAKKKGKQRRGGGHPIKGFRPGKEPKHLKQQRAKAQLVADASWAQKQTVEAIAGRSPAEVRKMVRTWTLGLLSGAVVLGVGGVFLYAWTPIAGGLAHVLTAVLLFLAFRLRKQSSGLEEMAQSLE